MSHRRSHTNLIAHAIWATKKREPMLQVSIDERLASFLRAKAIELECELVAVGNANDHVHVLVRDPSKVAVACWVHRLKGASSYQSDAVIDSLGCSLYWQDGFWAESCGPRAIDSLSRYISRQRKHHAIRAQAEPWERVCSEIERPACPALK